MTDQPKPLPCPFCGGEPYVVKHDDGATVVCRAKGCFSPFVRHTSRANAIAAWNTRHEPARPTCEEVCEAVETHIADNDLILDCCCDDRVCDLALAAIRQRFADAESASEEPKQ